MSAISFEIQKRASGGAARAGVIHTPHGDIPTPAFSPVGTKASVKGVLPEALKKLGADVVLANTYHLYLQPGEKLVEAAGGLGKFMGWDGPTITDSGGFQVFSLGAAFNRKVSKIGRATSDLGEVTEKEDQIAVYDESVASQHGQLAVIDDEGVTFTSHLDGSLHRFTPERSIEIQHALGADIFFAFDECTSPTEPYEYQEDAMRRTHTWAKRSLDYHKRLEYEEKKRQARTLSLASQSGQRPTQDLVCGQAIFGIVQGGRHFDLRAKSAKEIGSMGFDGIGIGGSFSKDDMRGALQAAVANLPEELPKHFLGIGEPGDILEGIANGMDLFDCVAATRLGRHGTVYTKRGPIHLKNEKYKEDFSLLDPETIVPGTETFTRAYVAHLLRSGEMLGQVIASTHNLGFILSLVAGAREAILEERFDTYRDDFVRQYYGS